MFSSFSNLYLQGSSAEPLPGESSMPTSLVSGDAHTRRGLSSISKARETEPGTHAVEIGVTGVGPLYVGW